MSESRQGSPDATRAAFAALRFGRWRDPRLLVPGACLLFHFALHWFYGRE